MSEWIKCSERMPPYDQFILAACRGAIGRNPSHYVMYLRRFKTDWLGQHWCGQDAEEIGGLTVDYWMPLPAPPPDQQQEGGS